MKRRLFMAVGASVLLIATLVPGGVLAKAPASNDRKVDASKVDPKFKPAVLSQSKRLDVYVKLAGAPVSVAQGAELEKTGKRLSNQTRARIRADLRARQDALKGRIQGLGGKVGVQMQDAVNAIRVNIARSRIPALSRLPGVVKVEPVRTYTRSNINTDQFIGAHRAWSPNQGYPGYTGYTGNNVRVAILDTGVDYYHANFGGSGDPEDFACDSGLDRTGGDAEECLTGRGVDTFPTAKVVGGRDFVGDCYNASEDPLDPTPPTAECPGGFSSIPQPDSDPLDCNGHGSHVAGTAAGFGVLAGGATFAGPYNSTTLASNDFLIAPGTAPRAKILAMRVFGCEGSTSVVVEALDQSVMNDADVINMSLGSVFGRSDELDSEATNNVSRAGVTVVASAGNSGPSAYITGSPAAATRAISVAALDAVPAMEVATIDFVTEANETAINANSADLSTPITADLHLFQDNPATAGDDESLGCDADDYIYNATVGWDSGDIAVVFRGVCARVQKAIEGDAQGAVAVIQINNASSLPPFEGPIAGVDIPFLGVTGTTATIDKFEAEDGNPATITDGGVVPNPTYRMLAGFTSFGPRNGDSAVKPDVAAPGVSVFSTLVGGGTAGTIISGTSMASPATAGVAALVKEAHPNWQPSRIKAAMVGTSNPNLLAAGNYDVRGAGAGVVQPRRAVDTATLINTNSGNASLDFGYEQLDISYSETRFATISNTSGAPLTYDLSVVFNKSSLGFTAAVSPTSVTVPAHGTANVQVTLSASVATLAALPDSVVPIAGFTPVTVVRGSLLVTPTTTGPGIYQVRSPFLVAPRGLSNVHARQKSAYTLDGDDANATVEVQNLGIHWGEGDVYQWGLSDRNEAYESGDLRAVGVQSFDCGGPCYPGGPSDDRHIVFAINTWGRWSNQSTDEYDIAIDTEPCPPATSRGIVCEDTDAEYFLVAVDLGAVLLGSFNGIMATFLFDGDGNFMFGEYIVPAAPNGSTILAAMDASDLGLGPIAGDTTGGGGDTDFNYTVASFSIIPGASVDEVTNEAGNALAWAGFDPWNPAVSQGDFLELDPGASETLELTVHRTDHFAQENRAKGWMVVTLNDANGRDQADTVHIGRVPELEEE